MSRSQLAFLVLVALVALQRIAELVISRRHERVLRSRGAIEHGQGHYRWMVALHTAFLVACPLEVLILDRPFHAGTASVMVLVLSLAQIVRYWSISTLGVRWTVRVFELPGAQLIARGPYRWLRHPNYLAVVLEFVALPLAHGAWLCAVVFSLLDFVMLAVRIAAENRALGYGSRRWTANPLG